jgi:pilus assembly protein Flp/PilA
MFDLIRYLIQSVRHREEGQGLVEYALIISLVSVAAIVALTALGGRISGLFDTILP